MNYAKIKDGMVENIISLHRSQETEFPDCVAMKEIPASIGDAYADGLFYRNGKQIKTELQKTNDKLQTISTAALSTTEETCKQLNEPPKANVGLFIQGASKWEVGKAYERFDLFSYNGAVGWVKQAHTSQETWLPFSVGTESLYGARPCPDEDDVYPYVYNMAVEVGMKVRHEDIIYECIQGTESLLYEPGQVPAMFTKVLASDENVISKWEQLEGANSYKKGDKVTHNGKTWISTTDGNVWEPGYYGWKEITE